MKKNYFYYIRLLSVFTILQSLIIIGFNLLVDPYGIFQILVLENFNQEKPSKITNPRLFKAIDIIRKKPKVLLLGSSRTDLGLDPNSPWLQAESSTYNLAISGVNSHELKSYFQHALVNQQDVKKVMIGLDFFMFNANRANKASFKQKRLQTRHLIFSDVLDSTFSIQALTHSFKTISFNQKPEKNRISPHLLNGMSSNAYFRKYVWQHSSIPAKFERSLTQFLSDPNRYGNYELSTTSIEDIQSVIETCRANNIEYVLFISPAHSFQWEAIRVAGLWLDFEEWKRKLVKISPLWDFSGYNTIATEPVSKEMQNYLDNSHYSQEIGNLMLQRMLKKEADNIPDNFGVLISPQNIESHLSTIRKEQKIWQAQNPDLVEYIEKIKQKVESQGLRKEMQ